MDCVPWVISLSFGMYLIDTEMMRRWVVETTPEPEPYYLNPATGEKLFPDPETGRV